MSGVAKSYAGKELALKCFSDQIVYTERLLANSVVDESGNFTFVVDVDSPVQAFVPMDLLETFRAGVECVLGEGKCHVLSLRAAGGVRVK